VSGVAQQFLISSLPIISVHKSVDFPFIHRMKERVALPDKCQFLLDPLIARPQPSDWSRKARPHSFQVPSLSENENIMRLAQARKHQHRQRRGRPRDSESPPQWRPSPATSTQLSFRSLLLRRALRSLSNPLAGHRGSRRNRRSLELQNALRLDGYQRAVRQTVGNGETTSWNMRSVRIRLTGRIFFVRADLTALW
jgi:hypothetical protein